MFVAQIYIGARNWDLPEFELGYFADKDHEGRGYVTESIKETIPFIFNRLLAHRIRIECDDTNLRSIRVAQRYRFIKERHIREDKRAPDGCFTGTVLFGLLCSEL